MFGKFPGAAGIDQAGGAVRQVDKTGRPLATFSRPIDNQVKSAVPDLRFPADMPVAPYGLSRYVAPEQKTGDLVKALQESPYWRHTAIVITYDENGGRWDHVAPPTADRWGPGTRIPAIIVSGGGMWTIPPTTQPRSSSSSSAGGSWRRSASAMPRPMT